VAYLHLSTRGLTIFRVTFFHILPTEYEHYIYSLFYVTSCVCLPHFQLLSKNFQQTRGRSQDAVRPARLNGTELRVLRHKLLLFTQNVFLHRVLE